MIKTSVMVQMAKTYRGFNPMLIPTGMPPLSSIQGSIEIRISSNTAFIE
jgi:hypothetical protein